MVTTKAPMLLHSKGLGILSCISFTIYKCP